MLFCVECVCIYVHQAVCYSGHLLRPILYAVGVAWANKDEMAIEFGRHEVKKTNAFHARVVGHEILECFALFWAPLPAK